MKLNIRTSNPEYAKHLEQKYDAEIDKINKELKGLRK